MAKRKPKSPSFEQRWLTRQSECGLDDLGPSEFRTCGDAVLPTEAAPFVCFEDAERQPRILEVFGPDGSWTARDRKRLAQYRMIGSDGAGNPICIEVKTGAVWVLDHDDYFRSRQFVNTSVALLAECLLACMGETDSARLLAAIKKLDRPAAAKGAFWNTAATELVSVREEE
jgi:SUKH-4 immunity protein